MPTKNRQAGGFFLDFAFYSCLSKDGGSKTSGWWRDLNFVKKVPIPLSRYDGTYKFDGSILSGGKYGGSLRKVLDVSGYDHEAGFMNARPDMEKPNPAHTKPRRREFDIEHLESALEAEADLFLTTDTKLIRRLAQAKREYPDDTIIDSVQKICLCPADALPKLGLT
jgi:hypothetical protein